MTYIIDTTIYQMSAPFRNGVIGSISSNGYNRMMLRTLIAMMIYNENVASKVKLSGN
jgi:hypothetical protein